MKLTYIGVLALSAIALPATAHRIVTSNPIQDDHIIDSSHDIEGLYCIDRNVDQVIKPRTKQGVIVKMQPFVLQKTIDTSQL